MVDSSPREVQTRAQKALSTSPIFVLRELKVEQHQAGLLLTGRVDTYYHKQLAQEAVRTVAGGFEVVNAIEVDGRRT